MVIEKERTYRLTGKGNFTIILKKSYQKAVKDIDGRVITSEYVPPLKAVFQNGNFDTKDEAVVALLQLREGWGTEFFWHPSEPEAKENMAKAKEIDKDKVARGKNLKRARQNRISNGPVQD